jgi:hypothetical protein
MGTSKPYGKWAKPEPVFTKDDIIRMLETTTFNDPDTVRTIYLPNKKFFEVFGRKESEVIRWETPNIGVIDVNFRPLYPKEI